MKSIIRPTVDRQRERDLTNRLVSAIAEELWGLYGGNGQLNWLEVERHLEQVVNDAREEAAESRVLARGSNERRADRETSPNSWAISGAPPKGRQAVGIVVSAVTRAASSRCAAAIQADV